MRSIIKFPPIGSYLYSFGFGPGCWKVAAGVHSLGVDCGPKVLWSANWSSFLRGLHNCGPEYWKQSARNCIEAEGGSLSFKKILDVAGHLDGISAALLVLSSMGVCNNAVFLLVWVRLRNRWRRTRFCTFITCHYASDFGQSLRQAFCGTIQ